MVSQNRQHIERYSLQDNGMWKFTDTEGTDGTIELSSIGCILTLSDVYRRVTFAEADEIQNSPDENTP